MTHALRLSLACAALFAAFAHAVLTGAPERAVSQTSVQTPKQTFTPPTGTQAGGPDYAGTAACLDCHSEKEADYKAQLHGKAANPRTPAAGLGCESCHGPGKKHAENPEDISTLRVFSKMPAREGNATCLTCHARSNHALWQGSAHDARNLSCATCHSIHSPKSPKAQLKTATEIETCATCHKPQVTKQMRATHMPVREGKMTCSTCHNPHGSTNVRQLRQGNWINESCASCHAEKRGPFLFDHAAGRESCVTCHDPHGSSNDRLLVAKLPMLCQRCHIGTRHPSTIYDKAAVDARSNRIIGRGCVNCHSQIHGSNHPSGQALVR